MKVLIIIIIYIKKNKYIYINYVGEILDSYRLFNNFNDNQISHKCNTNESVSDSLILLLGSNTVNGVHNKGSNHNFQFNFWIFLVKPSVVFLQIYYNLQETKKMQ
jgi:hypothetical protein